MKKVIVIFTFFLFYILNASGQGEIDQQQKIFYRNESTINIALNSTGYGMGYRYGKRLNFLNKRLYEVDFNYFRSPKEIRLSNPYFPNSRSFVFGKTNLFFNLRGGYGFQRDIYKKVDRGGVAVRYFYSFGPVLGFYKPVYYLVLYPISMDTYVLKEAKFDPTALHSPNDIYGRASFFKGWKEIKFVPGLFAKFGFNFEFSKLEPVVQALEGGIVIDAYPKKIPIMATEDNKSIFISLYASYRFGKIIDRYYKRAYEKNKQRGPTQQYAP